MEDLEKLPWAAILTLLVLAWSVGILALVEYMRRTFATRQQVEDVSKNIKEHGDDLKAWENAVDAKFVTRVELDGVGSKVNNLQHMFTSVHAVADEAKERSKEGQAEVRHLMQQVTALTATVMGTGTKVDRLAESFAELRGELRTMNAGRNNNPTRNNDPP